VQLPAGLENIGDYAFAGCGLTSLIIPNSVTSIGRGAFYDTNEFADSHKQKNRIQTLVIPDSVTEIGVRAFENCGIQTLTLGKGLTRIASDTFADNRITALTLPASVKEIGAMAFKNNQLTMLVIPNGVTCLWGSSFADNPLTSIVIPPSLAQYKESDGSFGSARGVRGAFREVSTLTSITLPADVDQSNLRYYSFGEDFYNFWRSQGEKAGTYVKNGRIWTLK
jgi:hypothetical protein